MITDTFWPSFLGNLKLSAAKVRLWNGYLKTDHLSENNVKILAIAIKGKYVIMCTKLSFSDILLIILYGSPSKIGIPREFEMQTDLQAKDRPIWLEVFQQKVRRNFVFNFVTTFVRFLLSFSKLSFFFKFGSGVSQVITSKLQFYLVNSDILQFRVSLMMQWNKSSFGLMLGIITEIKVMQKISNSHAKKNPFS